MPETLYHFPPNVDPDRIDQRVILHGIGWDDYEAVLAMRGESSATRVTYLEGELEFMSPSIDHETFKTQLARPAGGLCRGTEHSAKWLRLVDGQKEKATTGRRGR